MARGAVEAPHPFEEQVHGKGPHFVSWLCDDGQKRIDLRSDFDIVEAGQRHVLRDTQPMAPQDKQYSHRHVVVCGDNGLRKQVLPEQLLRNLLTALAARTSRIYVRNEAGFLHGAKVSGLAFFQRRNSGPAAHEGNVPEPLLDEMAGQMEGSGECIAPYRVGVDFLHGTVDQHHRDAVVQQHIEVVVVSRGGRN